MRERHVARLIILDAAGSLLLVRYRDDRPGRPARFWATPGGSLEQGESHVEAARREPLEETGLTAAVGRELWENRRVMDLWGSGVVEQHERFFLVQLAEVAPAVRNIPSAEDIQELRWWPMAELRTTTEVVFPDMLRASLTRAGLA